MGVRAFVENRYHDGLVAWMRFLIRWRVGKCLCVVDIGARNTICDFVKWRVLIRIDPSILRGKTATIYSTIINVRATWQDKIDFVGEIKPDCVFLMDVVEHIPKEEARGLLAKTASASKHVVVFTPRGFMPQEDGEWNTHRSGWDETDFGAGWKVYALPGFHTVDFKGNKLDRPVDALLAIFTNGNKI